MRQYLGEPHGAMATDEAAKRLALQKMAFEVAWRILRATPINATALVSALLLATRGVALTLDQLHHTLQDSLDYLERKQTPMTNSALRLRTPEGVRAALDALSGGHPVTRVDGGREPVWRIAPEDEHEAAFYRNTLIHAFLETSIVELALAYAARADGDRLDAFWAQAMRLRDLLKFDFYFADSAAFREHIAEEMSWHRRTGRPTSRPAVTRSTTLLRAKRPLMAQRDAAAVLRGLRDRRRRAARRARRDRREGADQAGARRRASVRRAGPGAQQRVGVRAVVRHRAPGGRRPASAGTRGRPAANAARRSCANCAASSRDMDRSSRSPASSSSRGRVAARAAAQRGRSLSDAPYAGRHDDARRAVPSIARATVWPVLSASPCWPVYGRRIGGAVAGGRADRHRTARPRARSPHTACRSCGPRARSRPSWRSGRSCSRRSWCRRSTTVCSTPPATARCAPAPSPRGRGRCARRCWCR